MSAARLAVRCLALALSLWSVACSSPPPPADPSGVAAPEDSLLDLAPEKAASRCASLKQDSARGTCVSRWSSANAGKAMLLADALMSERAPGGDGHRLALEALRRARPSAEKAGLLLGVADAALEQNDPRAADEALRGVKAIASSSGRSDLTRAADTLKAESLQQQGRHAEAYAIYEAQIRSDRTSVTAVSKAADALRASNDLARLSDLCAELFAGGDPERMRTLQVLTCLREDGTLSQEDADMALRALAAIPDLSHEDLEALAPAGLTSPRLDAKRCEEGWRPHPEEILRHVTGHGPLASLYLRLAEGKPPALRYCYLALAAKNCVAAFGESPECPEPRSLDLYLQAMASVDRDSIPIATSLLFEHKENLYQRWLGGTRRDGGRHVVRALIDMHIALAYVFNESRDLARQGQHYTPQYHVQRAEALWVELHSTLDPYEAPPEFPRKLLDRKLQQFLRAPQGPQKGPQGSQGSQQGPQGPQKGQPVP
ncbi:tetratricopeptide repeat protein [Sorangium sp. So ce861]|uniref:tetratricopeptide repeat protein n=1 Tax=Sorangium sp. So ce861 TaxID=3133323 RepID=UPI003F5F434E